MWQVINPLMSSNLRTAHLPVLLSWQLLDRIIIAAAHDLCIAPTKGHALTFPCVSPGSPDPPEVSNVLYSTACYGCSGGAHATWGQRVHPVTGPVLVQLLQTWGSCCVIAIVSQGMKNNPMGSLSTNMHVNWTCLLGEKKDKGAWL